MDFEVVRKDGFKVCGLSVELTPSQSENYKIIQSHWKNFNYDLRNKNIVLGKNWIKYGIIKKLNGKYFYMTAIPSNADISGFETEEIESGRYLLFSHVGKLNLITTTINDIYRVTIPKSGYSLNESRTIIHYEQYDCRFNWGKADSVIDIIVPISENT
ncbi:MAG: GyrI-like domain-containing protein [Gammaproteobacteria bacterium]|nr:GyrI-like domain-containing protein [Gammaproteobacteria bacterium]